MSVTVYRKTPRSRTIGINRDGAPIGVAYLITGGTCKGQWSTRAYTRSAPFDVFLGVFPTPELAAQAVAEIGETPDHLKR